MSSAPPDSDPLPVPPVPVDVVPYDPAWADLFRTESAKVRAALGQFVDGGVLEELVHIGSTSVPGLHAKPTIDMMGRIHPYPPSQETIEALEAIGYTWRGEYGLPGRTYFTKGPHDYHLHLVGFEGGLWERHVVFPAYLRASERARERYASLKIDLAERFHLDRPAYQDGKTTLVTILAREAAEWHLRSTGFTPVERLVTLFDGLPDDGLWAVSSGWALDLHLGTPSRYHDDLDVEVDARGQSLVQRHLADRGWRLDQVVDHGRYAPWPTGEPMAEGSHQAHARLDGEFIDLLFAPRADGQWRFRRDERVTLTLERALLRTVLPSGRSVRYLCPEAVLLFKSRSSHGGVESGPRGKDAEDFARVLPRLEAGAREWLAAALRVVHGEHVWLAELEGGAVGSGG